MSIKIMKHNKNLLEEYSEGSFDEIVNKLIEDVGDNMPVMELLETPVTTMRLKESTMSILDSLKVTPYESYENVIVRLLLLSKELNNNSD